MTHRLNAITHTQEYTLLPGVVRHTCIIFGLFMTTNLCTPDTKSWRRHWGDLSPCPPRSDAYGQRAAQVITVHNSATPKIDTCPTFGLFAIFDRNLANIVAPTKLATKIKLCRRPKERSLRKKACENPYQNN